MKEVSCIWCAHLEECLKRTETGQWQLCHGQALKYFEAGKNDYQSNYKIAHPDNLEFDFA